MQTYQTMTICCSRCHDLSGDQADPQASWCSLFLDRKEWKSVGIDLCSSLCPRVLHEFFRCKNPENMARSHVHGHPQHYLYMLVFICNVCVHYFVADSIKNYAHVHSRYLAVTMITDGQARRDPL